MSRTSQHSDVLLLRGLIERQSHGVAAAIPWLRSASVNRASSAVWLNLGQCLSEVGDFKGAENALLRASALQPDDIENHLCLAHLYRHLGQLGKARNTLEVAIRIDGSHGDTRQEMATLLHHG